MTSDGKVPRIWNKLAPNIPGPVIWKKIFDPVATNLPPWVSKISYTTIRNSSPHTLLEQGKIPYTGSHVSVLADNPHSRKDDDDAFLCESTPSTSDSSLIERLWARWLTTRRSRGTRLIILFIFPIAQQIERNWNLWFSRLGRRERINMVRWVLNLNL